MGINIKKVGGKVFKRNLLVISVVIALFATLFIAIYIMTNNSALEKQITQIEHRNLADISTGTKYDFEQISEICNFYANISLNNISKSYNDENYYSFVVMKKQIEAAKSVYSLIDNVYISNGKAYYQMGDNNLSSDLQSYKKRSFGYIGATEIYEVLDDKFKNNIFFEYQLDGLNNVFVGVEAHQMAKQIFKEEKFGRNEFLIDENGKVIFSMKSSQIGENVWKTFDIDEKIPAGTTSRIKYNGQKYFISVQKMSQLNLYSVSVVDENLYSNYFNQSTLSIIVLSISFFILACIVGAVLLITTYKPIKNISDEINKYAPSIDLYKKDEVKYITDITRNLYFQNKDLSSFVYEKVNEIRKNQIKMLQAQICPHFVCNTLEAMNWLAYQYIKKRNNPLSQTIQNMSSILENNLDLSSMFTTIGEEIAITEKYIEIINVRYENSFDIYWDIDDSVRDCMIMKLCMQPLIENVASHAFSELDRRGEIKISVKENGDDIIVSVSDNGVGMSEEYLNELIGSINDFEKINSSKHIGLRNINHRLRLLYGEEYKISLVSEPNKGTTCSFRILKAIPTIE